MARAGGVLNEQQGGMQGLRLWGADGSVISTRAGSRRADGGQGRGVVRTRLWAACCGACWAGLPARALPGQRADAAAVAISSRPAAGARSASRSTSRSARSVRWPSWR